MLTKDQAIAAADALIIKVEAEKRRRLERRTSRWSVQYPVIKLAPLEEREALHRDAVAAPRTRWLVIGTAVAITIAVTWAYFELGVASERRHLFVIMGVAISLISVARFIGIRMYLQREVPLRYPKSDEHASRSGA